MSVVAYNIKSIPEGMTVEDIIEIFYASGVLLYDGIPPYMLDENNLDMEDIVLVNKEEWLNSH